MIKADLRKQILARSRLLKDLVSERRKLDALIEQEEGNLRSLRVRFNIGDHVEVCFHGLGSAVTGRVSEYGGRPEAEPWYRVLMDRKDGSPGTCAHVVYPSDILSSTVLPPHAG